jgi:hypothetical protein
MHHGKALLLGRFFFGPNFSRQHNRWTRYQYVTEEEDNAKIVVHASILRVLGLSK